MIALVLALALGAAPAGTAKKPSTSAAKKTTATPGEAARLAEEAAALAKEAANLAEQQGVQPQAPVEQTLPSDVMGFLSLTQSTASRDGGVKLPWEGPGGAQLKLSWDALDKRNEQLAMGDMMARSLVEAVRMFYDTEGGVDPQAMRGKLANLTGAPMEDARVSYLDAVTWEERRLFFVEKAIQQADAERTAIPGVDPDLVARRIAAIRSGQVKQVLQKQVEGYRDLALGLVNYLDGDNFGALQKVRNAAAALPDFAVAHAFLGSLYFLFDQKDAAVRAWRRAYELDPTNTAVRDALMEHGREKKAKQQKK